MTTMTEAQASRMSPTTEPVDDDSGGAAGLMPGIEIAVRVLDPAWRRLWPSPVGRIRNAARIALDMASRRSRKRLGATVELAVVLADDGLVRRLNRQYRGIDKPTNVLSFDGAAGEDDRASSLVVLGDVILARETVAAEAAVQGKTVADHAVHLVVHGVLHLLGHDHQVAREANLMESIEIRALARLGVADPYAAHPRRHSARRRA